MFVVVLFMYNLNSQLTYSHRKGNILNEKNRVLDTILLVWLRVKSYVYSEKRPPLAVK